MKESQDLIAFEPFVHLSAPARQLLLQRLVRKGYRQRETVLHKGQPASGAYVVLTGVLRVFTIAPNGTEATLYRVEPGQTCVLALNCLFNDLLYPAWVQADSASRVGVIPGAVYRSPT